MISLRNNPIQFVMNNQRIQVLRDDIARAEREIWALQEESRRAPIEALQRKLRDTPVERTVYLLANAGDARSDAYQKIYEYKGPIAPVFGPGRYEICDFYSSTFTTWSRGSSDRETLDLVGHKSTFDELLAEVRRIQREGRSCSRQDVKWSDPECVIITYLI